MSQETINLLIGALIGIVSSILSQIVGNHYQNKREIRARNWELEDRRVNQIMEVKRLNLESAREYVNVFLDAIQKLRWAENSIIYSRDVTKFKEDIEGLLAIQEIAIKKAGSIAALRNAKLTELCDQLRQLHFSQFQKANNIREALINNSEAEIDKDALGNELVNFSSEAGRLILEINATLDEIAQDHPLPGKAL